MTRDELLHQWRDRLSEWREIGVHVSGEAVARRIIADIEGLSEEGGEEGLTLTQAAQEGGVSTRQLARLIRSGALENVGRRNAPRVRRGDIPRKPHATPGIAKGGNSGTLSLQLARQAITSKSGGRGGKNGTQS